MQKRTQTFKAILEQGFCPLQTEIAQLLGIGFRLNLFVKD